VGGHVLGMLEWAKWSLFILAFCHIFSIKNKITDLILALLPNIMRRVRDQMLSFVPTE
jgi:hypothetical protein